MKTLLALLLACLTTGVSAGVEVRPVGPSMDRQTLQETGKYYVEPVAVVMLRAHRGQTAVPEKVTYDSVFVGERRTTDGVACYRETHQRSAVASRLPNGDQTYPITVSSHEIPCLEKN